MVSDLETKFVPRSPLETKIDFQSLIWITDVVSFRASSTQFPLGLLFHLRPTVPPPLTPRFSFHTSLCPGPFVLPFAYFCVQLVFACFVPNSVCACPFDWPPQHTAVLPWIPPLFCFVLSAVLTSGFASMSCILVACNWRGNLRYLGLCGMLFNLCKTSLNLSIRLCTASCGWDLLAVEEVPDYAHHVFDKMQDVHSHFICVSKLRGLIIDLPVMPTTEPWN